ncbi:unnamed protein product [Hermetia illucens]|uniref:Uncharacterized protein n=1 Tax=Hermetia illucens TaxID=343691 RepID=A0A7R8V0Z7_HERIL|nr:unnamed protein product [Hermetia illucens]
MYTIVFMYFAIKAIKLEWHFIPQRAPHFGELLESAVKSTKFHLTRIMGNTPCTSEGMNTALLQIEGCLNSSPLCKIADDWEDEEVLTPNHFLMEPTLVMVPVHESGVDT